MTQAEANGNAVAAPASDSPTDPLVDLSARYANHVNRPVILLALSDAMGRHHADQLRKQLRGKTFDEVDVIVHSPGGDIHAAYKITQTLAFHAKYIRAVVPSYAKSAATLLCLGADEIVMDEAAELGPLDSQLGQPEGGELAWRSGLNPFKTLELLRQFSLESLDHAMKMVTQRCEMSPAEAMEHATTLVGTITTPLYAQLDPDGLGESGRALQVGHEYGKRVLARHSKVEPRKREAIVDQLVYGYPAHGFVVDREELGLLGLSTTLMDENVQELFHDFTNIASRSTRVTLIEPNVQVNQTLDQEIKVVSNDKKAGDQK